MRIYDLSAIVSSFSLFHLRLYYQLSIVEEKYQILLLISDAYQDKRISDWFLQNIIFSLVSICWIFSFICIVPITFIRIWLPHRNLLFPQVYKSASVICRENIRFLPATVTSAPVSGIDYKDHDWFLRKYSVMTLGLFKLIWLIYTICVYFIFWEILKAATSRF